MAIGFRITSKAEIPRDVVRYVAQLVKVYPDRFDSYDWQGRTIKAHRAIMRDFLGITEATVKDAENLTAWLETQVWAYDLKPESLEIAARGRLPTKRGLILGSSTTRRCASIYHQSSTEND